MYLSLNCLKDFIKVPNKLGAAEISELLTLHTVEVESWRLQKDDFNQVIVAKVASVSPHPNADRLRLAKVDTGKEMLDIVCGATNLAKGQKVAVALIGAKLSNGLEIKESEIRGQKSYGMICAEDELGLGNNHEGIIVLSEKAKVGQDLADYLDLNDVILEIDNKSLSNRADLWGHYGLARELSVLLKTPLKPAIQISDDLLEIKNSEKISVKIEGKNICSRYVALKINNVKAIESPQWLKDRLSALGLKPINALVDITNYVMLELGQPLHAFDATGIKKIVVRESKKGESLETLDNKERLLPENTIVISDSNELIAIAGIMGAAKSSINENTTSIILEAATFDAVSVRRATQALNLRTDASVRFEKSLDPQLPTIAWQRAWQLIKQIIPEAELAGEPIDIFPEVPTEKRVSLDFSWLKNKLGYDISRKEVVNILERLGFQVVVDKNIFDILIPSWRAVKDVSLPEDILEEVARIVGYNKIISSAPLIEMHFRPKLEENKLEKKIQDILSGAAAMNEVYNYSFVGENLLSKLNLSSSHYLRLLNPLNNNHQFLRQNLLVGLISNARLNQSNFNHFSLFELGRVFLPIPGMYAKNAVKPEDVLPYQGKRLALLVANNEADKAFSRLKGILQLLLKNLAPSYLLEFVPVEDDLNWADNNTSLNVIWEGKEIGFLAQVDQKVANSLGLKIKTVIAELNFQDILNILASSPVSLYEPVPKYPPVTRDLAFVVNEKILYNDFWKEMINFNPLLHEVELFDVYQGNKLGDNLKSWAFHLTYQDLTQTLTSDQVDNIQKDLINHLQNKFEAQIRSF